jgi:16S rRNA (guanine527-N7)-methyltransferase
MLLPILRHGAAELGLNLSERQYEQFEEYYRFLIEWNARFNLTAITDYEAVQTVHFLDSLTIILSSIDLTGRNVIDIGAGAGFPGIPLKIVFPDIKLILLEATGKKATFLNETVGVLGLQDVGVLNTRAEVAAHQPEHREKYDVVISRAVAPLDTLSELCLPFCRIGGTFIAMKKGEIGAEVNTAAIAIQMLGGVLPVITSVNLTEFADDRKLVVIKKTNSSPSQYPRRDGVPAKKPLR